VPAGREQWIGDVHPAWIGEAGASIPSASIPGAAGGGAIEPRGTPAPPNVVTIPPGTSMAEVERAVVEAALRETRGNRRRAAEMLGIGERTLYRKIREYRLPELEFAEAVGGGGGEGPGGVGAAEQGGGSSG
jgi:DNA-binding NtrC family response regulator